MSGGVGGRSRWASLGGAVVLLLAGGRLLTASAAGSSTASSFVPITPCRLFDTRPGADNIGPRSTPLGPDETYVSAVSGSNGNCTIPTGVTGVSLGVVVTNPNAASYLTVFPADAPRPLASSLNWVAGQAPTPNAVTASLSADGRLALYNLAGTVDVVVDIVGYYESASSGPAGPTGPPGPPGAPGDPGARPARVVWVAAAGGDFSSLSAALASITDNSASKPYVVKLAPGTYTETEPVSVKDYVDIEGSGQDTTTLTCACGASELVGTSSTLRAVGTPHLHAEVRLLTVANTGGGAEASVGTFLGGVSAGRVKLHNVTSTATGGTDHNIGVQVANSDPILTNVTAVATGTTGENRGLSMSKSSISSSPTVTNVTAVASGNAALNVGVQNIGFASVMTGVTATATGGTSAFAVSTVSSSMTMIGGSATARGASAGNTGIFVTGGGSPTFDTVTATATDGGLERGIHNQGSAATALINVTAVGSDVGVDNTQTATMTVRDSFVTGSSNSIRNTGSTVQVANTRLGAAVQGPMTCIGAYDSSTFVVLGGDCQ